MHVKYRYGWNTETQKHTRICWYIEEYEYLVRTLALHSLIRRKRRYNNSTVCKNVKRSKSATTVVDIAVIRLKRPAAT
jgi:hypothetical protein